MKLLNSPRVCMDIPSWRAFLRQIGRLLIYESGAVKLALGDVLLDVGLGTEAAFRQDLALVSAEDEECTFLGGVHTRAVACPDISHLLGRAPGRMHIFEAGQMQKSTGACVIGG